MCNIRYIFCYAVTEEVLHIVVNLFRYNTNNNGLTIHPYRVPTEQSNNSVIPAVVSTQDLILLYIDW